MPDPRDIYHWHRLDDQVTTSGQPTETQLVEIAGLGVRRVINLGLHTHPRALRDEAASVAALAMDYVHIPVEFSNPTEADFNAFCTAVETDKNELLHVHCIANYRVSAFFCRYRRDVLGLTEDQVRDDLLQVWVPDPVWDAFIRRGRPG